LFTGNIINRSNRGKKIFLGASKKYLSNRWFYEIILYLCLPAAYSVTKYKYTMRKHIKLLRILFAFTVLFSIHTVSFSQPPPPPPGNGHGQPGNNPPGAGAPIGEGMFLLIGLAGLYGGKKVLNLRKSIKVKAV